MKNVSSILKVYNILYTHVKNILSFEIITLTLQTEKRFGVFPCDKAEDILVLFLLLCGRFLCEYWHVLGKEDKM
jgi:hypothetical protein